MCAAFAATAARVGARRGDFTVEDTSGRLYALWRGGPVSLLLDAGYGTLTVKGVHRTTAVGGLPAGSKTGGDHWGAGLKAAWHGELGSKTRTVSGRLANNFTRPTAIGLEDGDGLELGGAATASLGKNWSASLGDAADIRRHERLANRATLSLQTGF